MKTSFTLLALAAATLPSIALAETCTTGPSFETRVEWGLSTAGCTMGTEGARQPGVAGPIREMDEGRVYTSDGVINPY